MQGYHIPPCMSLGGHVTSVLGHSLHLLLSHSLAVEKGRASSQVWDVVHTRGLCAGPHATSYTPALLLAGQLEFLKSGLSEGFPSGGCLWKYWQEWEGVITSVDIWGLALGNLRLVSTLGGKGAGEWGVYPLTSPLPPSLAESCSPGRQTDNFQALVCPSKG